ncbi:Transmembrane protein 184C [Hondaea fermentalgiana]|uniref:Transmembrane protein 184C n=1 Tax=Hondaea fermentalgiana TaxID=2315210 RepID=A0A2R5G1K2_9STRA|nr:Transmembrane protein 184C [Hondaea fermentalgiana]|eukprot:GBG24906.1 Transmembrane protein 184C [Hondaea fermentalgiana]
MATAMSPDDATAAAQSAAQEAAAQAAQAAVAAHLAQSAQKQAEGALGTLGADAWLHMGPVLTVAGIFTLLAICGATITLLGHLTHFTLPAHQKLICRIVLLVPVYALISFVALLVPAYAVALDTLRGCYEAFVIYTFLALLLTYLGGERQLGSWLETRGHVQHWGIMAEVMSRRRNIALGPVFLRRVQQGVLQFVFVKPFTALLALVLSFAGVHHEGTFSFGDAYLYLSLVNNLSVSVALYCLVLFYLATETILQPFKPLSKFFAVKAVVFFSYWQACSLQTLFWLHILPSRTDVSVLQNSLICVEMFIAAIAHHIAFSSADYALGDDGRAPIDRLMARSEIFRDSGSSAADKISVTVPSESESASADAFEDITAKARALAAQGAHPPDDSFAPENKGRVSIKSDQASDETCADDDVSASLLPKFITVLDGRDLIHDGKHIFIDKTSTDVRMELADAAPKMSEI